MNDASPALEPLLPRRIWWPWDQPAERVGFERAFKLQQVVPATLYVAASGTYAAWLDGQPIPVPPSHAPSWRIIHRIPLELAAGGHRLSVEATPGPHGQPFLLACLDWMDGDGIARVATDANWRMFANPPAGWAVVSPESSHDRETWRDAWAFDGVWAEPWGMPCNVPDDFCRLSHGWQVLESAPLRSVVQVHPGLSASGASVRGADGAVEFRPPLPFPLAPFVIPDVRAQDLAYRSREAHSHILNQRLELFERRAPHVVFDVGAETFGRIRVRVRSGGSAILAVTTGESVPEVHRHIGRVTDIFELRNGESFCTGLTGFRFVKVMGLSAGGPGTVVLDPPEVQHVRYPVEFAGEFACSDEVLNDIWRLSARTVHLCMQNEIWDGIKRDQLPWMGDLYTEALAIYHAFGDTRLARHSLGILGEIGPTPDRPLERQRYPGLQSMWKRPGADINGIPSYTMWWVVGLAEYLRFSGDRSLIEDLLPELRATLRHIAAGVDAHGRWHHRQGWDYVDWAPLSAAERADFCHLLACQVMGAGAELLSAVGASADEYRELQVRMTEAARREIWRGGAADYGPMHHVPAMLIRSGVLTSGESQRVFEQSLAGDPPCRMTFWHRYADLDAAARVGQIAWGLNYIRKHWGYARDAGMTALWEAFDPAWLGEDPHGVSMIAAEHARYGGYETSLCHGWSAGPAAWLHRAVLGVTPAEPGFAAIRFAPALGDLTWAEGVIPSPRGAIGVRLTRSDDGSPRAELAIPREVELRPTGGIATTWDLRVSRSAQGVA